MKGLEEFEKEIERITEREKEMSTILFNLRTTNLANLTSFSLNTIVLSSTIILAIIPLIFNNTSVFKHLHLSLIGLMLLIITDIIGIIYINICINKQSKEITRKNIFYHELYRKSIELICEEMSLIYQKKIYQNQ